jgi:hypothetical protein
MDSNKILALADVQNLKAEWIPTGFEWVITASFIELKTKSCTFSLLMLTIVPAYTKADKIAWINVQSEESSNPTRITCNSPTCPVKVNCATPGGTTMVTAPPPGAAGNGHSVPSSA